MKRSFLFSLFLLGAMLTGAAQDKSMLPGVYLTYCAGNGQSQDCLTATKQGQYLRCDCESNPTTLELIKLKLDESALGSDDEALTAAVKRAIRKNDLPFTEIDLSNATSENGFRWFKLFNAQGQSVKVAVITL